MLDLQARETPVDKDELLSFNAWRVWMSPKCESNAGGQLFSPRKALVTSKRLAFG